MKTKTFRNIFAAMIAVAGIAAVHASTFTVGGSGNTFTISRSGVGTNAAETVLYRTVGLSAYSGQHFTAKSGTLDFAPGQTSTNVVVSVRSPSETDLVYKYQTGTSRAYRLEITDRAGAFLDSRDSSVSSGLLQFSAAKVSSNIVNLVTLYRYFKTKPDLVIELGVVLWKKYYVEVEKAYAARGGAAMNAAEEMEFFIDSIIELYRSHKDVLKFNRNFDTYVKHQECTAEQMRPYNEAVEVFAHKFHVVYEKAMKDGTLDIRVSERRLFVGTLYAVLSVAGKFAEGLVYPSEDHHNMLDELLMIKQMILGALKKGRMGTVGTMGTLATATPQGPQSLQGPQSPQKGVAC